MSETNGTANSDATGTNLDGSFKPQKNLPKSPTGSDTSYVKNKRGDRESTDMEFEESEHEDRPKHKRVKHHRGEEDINEKLEVIKTQKPKDKVSAPLTPEPTQTTERSYAQLATVPQTDRKPPAEWKSPVATKPVSYDTVIKIKEGDNGDPITELKKVLTSKDVEKFQIRRTQTAVVINTKTREEQKHLLKKLENVEKITAKDGTRTQSPMILITGVQKGKSEEELLSNIKQENEDLDELFGQRMESELKRLGARNCKNVFKENIIVSEPSDIIKHILKKGFIYMDLMKYYVEEHISVSMCFKCCRFGHSAKLCNYAIDVCYKCAQRHSGATCQSGKVECINCGRSKSNIVEQDCASTPADDTDDSDIEATETSIVSCESDSAAASSSNRESNSAAPSSS
ncbi:unnamed protein product [Psylliodes chrysocephalus]|uniref:Gag-like protein n=1 Tax=Psylliodes chrysocephalus TaxID=3402493 RepID=A0A9P0GHF1_9CUCU|nr:unnamed protein product [Psylliodes chrysocephala]